MASSDSTSSREVVICFMTERTEGDRTFALAEVPSFVGFCEVGASTVEGADGAWSVAELEMRNMEAALEMRDVKEL